jgi:demethylspheroidene O-methyltransferase
MMAGSWREGWIALRNRWLADPRFHRAALDFPLTRGIALRRVASLFDIVAGFIYSQTLDVCIRLGLLEILAKGPRTIADLARGMDLPLDSADRLLAAAAALGLAEPLDHAECVGKSRYALGAEGAALLGNPGLAQMISHHHRLYADLTNAVDLLRRPEGGGELATFWPYATAATPRVADAESVGGYSALMAATQPTVAADIFKAYPLRRHRRMMDVGGGSGAFLSLAGAHAPGLHLTLFDLPAVTEHARPRLSRAGLMERTEIIGGDFLADPLPKGADLITLVRILHDHDDAGVARLLRSAREALPADGALLVAEPMSAAPKPDRIADAYFGFYLLAMGRGRARTPRRIMDMMREAGFRRARELKTRTPSLLRVILARP